MEPSNNVFAGALIRNRVYPSSGINDVVSYSNSAGRHTVACSPLRKGNHKSPLPHNFHIGVRHNGPLEATFTIISSGDTDYWSGNFVGITENLATWIAQDTTSAREQAYADLMESIRGSTDLSVDLFQLRQTVGTPSQVLKIVTDMRKVIRKLKKGDITAPMKQAGNAWLLWVYGVKPTMQSIHDAVSFNRKHYIDEIRVYEGRKSIVTSKDIAVPDWPDAGGWTSTCKVKSSVRVQYKIRLKVPDNDLTSLSRLTSLNPASIAWELMPWSFVFDWFYNIGDYVRGLETSVLYEKYFTDGFVTTTTKVEGTQTAERSGTPPTGVSWSGSYQATGEDKLLDRSILSTFPPVPPPQFNTRMSSGRLLNAAALLTTFLGRKST